MLRKWVAWYGDRVIRYRDLFRDVLVRLASVEYSFCVSLQIFMAYGRSVKEYIPLIHFLLYLLFLINCQRSLDLSLPNSSKIAPQSLPNCFPIAPWSAKAVLLNFFLASEAANLKPPSNIDFTAPFTSSENEPLKIWLADYTSGWSFSPNPPNVLTSMRITERPPRQNTTP